MASRTSAALEIRKLRKKLRQIENLERKDGDLLDEELLKVFIIHRHNVDNFTPTREMTMLNLKRQKIITCTFIKI